MSALTKEIQYYKGLWFTSFRGIYICFIGFLIGMCLYYGDVLILVAFLMFLGMWLPVAWAMNYFGVSGDAIIVRHHIFFWKRKRYKLGDIKQVLLHSKGGALARNADRLTITLNDDTQKSFQGATLRSHDWVWLEEKLVQVGVNVKDELEYKTEASPQQKRLMRKMYTYFTTYLVIVLGTIFLIPTKNQAPEWVILTAKLVWVASVFIGIVVVKKLIIRAAGKEGDKG